MDNSAKFDSKALYSCDWASYILSKFKRDYPRATEMAAEGLGLYDKDIVNFLAANSCFWQVFKDLVHNLDIILKNREYQAVREQFEQFVTTQMCSVNNVKSWKKWSNDHWEVLTACRTWANLNSRGFKGCSRAGAKRKRGNKPFSGRLKDLIQP